MVIPLTITNKEWQTSLTELVREGALNIQYIDDAVRRILRVKFELGLFENPYTDEENYKEIIRCKNHRELSYCASLEACVLLQNKNRVLPLSKNIKSIALIGPSSGKQRIGSYSSVPYGYHVNSL